MEASRRKQNSSLGCANIFEGQLAGQADLPMAFSLLTLCLLLQRLMATEELESFKPEPVLLCQTHNFFEAPLPIKQPGYSGRLSHNMSSNRN